MELVSALNVNVSLPDPCRCKECGNKNLEYYYLTADGYQWWSVSCFGALPLLKDPPVPTGVEQEWVQEPL
jgi:hypothetical protein